MKIKVLSPFYHKILHLFSIKHFFYDKMDLRIFFLFLCDDQIHCDSCHFGILTIKLQWISYNPTSSCKSSKLTIKTKIWGYVLHNFEEGKYNILQINLLF